MGIWVTLSMKIKPGSEQRLRTFLEQNLANVRGFDGAMRVSLFLDPETRAFLLLEKWKSRDHHGAYLKSIEESGVMTALLAFMEGPPSVQYYEALEL